MAVSAADELARLSRLFPAGDGWVRLSLWPRVPGLGTLIVVTSFDRDGGVRIDTGWSDRHGAGGHREPLGHLVARAAGIDVAAGTLIASRALRDWEALDVTPSARRFARLMLAVIAGFMLVASLALFGLVTAVWFIVV
jgi:hypothetical protein